MRIFAQEVVGDGNVISFFDPCGAQETAVFSQELPHAARVGGIPLIEEELRSGVPPPFQDWVVDVKKQLVLVEIQQPLGFVLVVKRATNMSPSGPRSTGGCVVGRARSRWKGRGGVLSEK